MTTADEEEPPNGPEAMVETLRGRCRAALVLPLAVLAAPGCGDAVRDAARDPLAGLITEETRAALALGLDLTSLPGLLDEAAGGVRGGSGGVPTPGELGTVGGSGHDGASHGEVSADGASPGGEGAAGWLREEAERWEATWLLDPAEGRDARAGIYDRALGPVSRALGEARVRAELERVDRLVQTVAHADLRGLPPDYRAGLDEARRLVDRGRSALERGVTVEALRAALEAADRLRAMSPRRVAGSLLERARRGLEEVDRTAGMSEVERERILRLVRGAASALEEAEYPLAIRRAYYACRLLGLPVS